MRTSCLSYWSKMCTNITSGKKKLINRKILESSLLKCLPREWVERPANCIKKSPIFCFQPSNLFSHMLQPPMILSGQNFSINGGQRQLHEGLHYFSTCQENEHHTLPRYLILENGIYIYISGIMEDRNGMYGPKMR